MHGGLLFLHFGQHQLSLSWADCGVGSDAERAVLETASQGDALSKKEEKLNKTEQILYPGAPDLEGLESARRADVCKGHLDLVLWCLITQCLDVQP